MITTTVLIVYAVLLIAGGLIGFKKGSNVSLIAGLVSGILVFVGLWLTSFTPKVAWIFLTCLNVALAAAFISRFIKTQAFMPSGMLLLMALAMLVFCFIQFKKY